MAEELIGNLGGSRTKAPQTKPPLPNPPDKTFCQKFYNFCF